MFYQGHTNHNIWYVIENLSSHTLIEFCTVVRFTCGLSENILSSFDSHTGRVKNYGRSHSEQGNGKCSAYSAVHWYQTCNSKNNLQWWGGGPLDHRRWTQGWSGGWQCGGADDKDSPTEEWQEQLDRDSLGHSLTFVTADSLAEKNLPLASHSFTRCRF